MAQGFSVTYTVVDNATAQINAINRRIQQMRAPLDAQAKAMTKFLNVSGLKSVAQGFGEIAKTAKSAAVAVTSIVPAMGALTSAATLGGIAKLVSNFGELGEELIKTGNLLGETPEKLYGIGQAMRFFGGNAQVAIDALVGLKNAQYDAVLGMNATAAAMAAKLKVPLVDAGKHFRDVADVQHDLFAAFDQLPNEMDRVRAATIMGGTAMAQLYQQYQFAGVSLDQWTAKQKELATLNKEQIKAYQQFELALGPLNAAFYDLGATVGASVAPAMTDLFRFLTGYVQDHKGEIAKEVDSWVKAFEDWLQNGGTDKLKQNLDDIGTVLGTVLAAIRALAQEIRSFPDMPWWMPKAIGMDQKYVPGPDAPKLQPVAPEKQGGFWNWVGRTFGAKPAAAPAAPGPEAPAAPGPEAPAAPPVNIPVPGGGVYAPIPPAAPSAAPGPQGAATPGAAPAAFKAAIESVESPGGRYNNAPLKGHSATGPRQMMPSTFAAFAQPGERIDNPEDNRRVSDRYIDSLWNKYGGDPQKTAYAYANGSLVSPDRNPGYVGKVMAAYNSPTAPTPDSAPKPPNTPGGGSAGDVVDQMVALAGTRGAAVRQFLRDPNGVVKRDPDLGLWCAEFTNAYLQHAGVKGTGSLMAASFANWGKQVAAQDVTKGDVLLNYNRKHVGVATGRTRVNAQGQFEVEEVSSNSLGPGGEVMNLPGTRWRHDVEVRRSAELALAEQRAKGPPASLQAGGGMPNGSVGVTVTHKNAPADVNVSAQATGNGINLAPPRVEYQHMGQV